jgi:hypothetical protein
LPLYQWVIKIYRWNPSSNDFFNHVCVTFNLNYLVVSFGYHSQLLKHWQVKLDKGQVAENLLKRVLVIYSVSFTSLWRTTVIFLLTNSWFFCFFFLYLLIFKAVITQTYITLIDVFIEKIRFRQDTEYAKMYFNIKISFFFSFGLHKWVWISIFGKKRIIHRLSKGTMLQTFFIPALLKISNRLWKSVVGKWWTTSNWDYWHRIATFSAKWPVEQYQYPIKRM